MTESRSSFFGGRSDYLLQVVVDFFSFLWGEGRTTASCSSILSEVRIE